MRVRPTPRTRVPRLGLLPHAPIILRLGQFDALGRRHILPIILAFHSDVNRLLRAFQRPPPIVVKMGLTAVSQVITALQLWRRRPTSVAPMRQRELRRGVAPGHFLGGVVTTLTESDHVLRHQARAYVFRRHGTCLEHVRVAQLLRVEVAFAVPLHAQIYGAQLLRSHR